MSSVSWAMRCWASGRMCSRVRMLCVRSASLTRMTRMSLAIATSILRKFSACFSSTLTAWEDWKVPSLVTPSTRSSTSWPNSSRISSGLARVSSMVSCKRPETMLASSSFRSEGAELGHPFHQIEHFLAEQLADLLRLGEGVLDGVVQEAGDDAGLVQLQIGQKTGHF